ncbi:hypothetical protein [uncultured Alistipes sp.]|mgnify:CR=1 FL=1|uniref:hypothetical protein n=1 Tax=uncultured Alistipes sp. TaxID=538949 RepID=UPI0025CCEAF7|nr:hypothetical protein [uncultured Alistipes sp.]
MKRGEKFLYNGSQQQILHSAGGEEAHRPPVAVSFLYIHRFCGSLRLGAFVSVAEGGLSVGGSGLCGALASVAAGRWLYNIYRYIRQMLFVRIFYGQYVVEFKTFATFASDSTPFGRRFAPVL